MTGAGPAAGGRRPDGIRVLQWAQEHGEVGGVTTAVHGLTGALRARGFDVRYVDTGSPRRAARALPWLWRRRSLHVLHITRLWRALVLAPVFAVLPGRTAVGLHSGSVLGQVRRMRPPARRLLGLALRAFDEIWAVNEEIRAVLPPGLHSRIRVVSPFVPSAGPSVGPGRGAGAAGEAHLVSVATNAGLAHYNAELALEAMTLVRRTWPDARLWVLAYGADGPAMAALRRRVEPLPWARLSFDLPPAQVSAALATSAVFLRPTSWDGDSMIVREALALGTRVVASDVSPRPAGVELCPLTADGLAAAGGGGGPVSDGAGLSTDSVLDAALAALAGLAARRSVG